MNDWMSMVYFISFSFLSELRFSLVPMNILIFLLIISWFLVLFFLSVGGEVWSLIYLVMVFNGGLMIIYLFVISMIPKEKSVYSSSLFVYMFFFSLFFSPVFSEKKFSFGEFMNLSFWILFFLVVLICVFSFVIFLMMMDPFKSMSSSF